MAWSKTKQLLESFLCDSLKERVRYNSTAYRYAADKAGRCYITVDKKQVFDMSDLKAHVTWYKTEQEIKSNPNIIIPVSEDEICAVREDSGDKIPEERLKMIARNRKISEYARELISAQAILSKSDFYIAANTFLSSNVNDCLKSEEIILNVLALVDRRIGKKRLRDMHDSIKLKHPIVKYFYDLRCEADGVR